MKDSGNLDRLVFYTWNSRNPGWDITSSYTDGSQEVEVLASQPRLIKIVYNNPYTIAFWCDGTQTKARCLPEDTYSAKKGLFVCRMKRKYGSWTKYEEHKKAKKEEKEIRSILRKLGRQVELANAIVIDLNK